ncbi:methionine ABC transporter ATP-binding protein [Enteractinococcus coprophilus]|uniref:D-methionine transport system ATP-binding protein n=1 Tax=Enteractinococcus coprophilus TaxID=1027633 RepID=A0A543AGC3_9MICC|nr:ATP-binding cassette domain-containing protein [Enteractinococcus coprophilus]TQL71607.1 D-methionine transport system ATP-binding protein [Enteractinococcus coprophilus]
MISVRELTKVYRQPTRDVVAIDDINLDIDDGEIHGIIGRSGAGKSTLVRCLTLLDRPTKGQVIVGSQDLTAVSDTKLRNARRRIGMVFQHANLLSSRTVAENVAMPLEIVNAKKAERRARALELLELVGLQGLEDTYPAQLSGGQRQRVGIARALAADPDVLLCDEPTSALDPNTTDDILTLIRSVADRLHLTVVVITHEMLVVKNLCDSVSLLEAGKIVESGKLSEVAADVNSQLSRSLLPLPTHQPVTADLVIEVVGKADAVNTPIGSTIAAENPVTVDIAAANIETLGTTRFAHYLLGINSDQPINLTGIEATLARHGFSVRVRAARGVQA